MSKSVLLFASMTLTVVVLLACGVALAATITCRGTTSCFGTDRPDTMTGTRAANNMFGEGGADVMQGKGGADYVRGDRGADTLHGGRAGDTTLWGGGFDVGGNYNDASDDYVHGDTGADTIIGGFAVGGVDVLYGSKGNDVVNVAQRSAPDVRVTKEIVDCGPGSSDTVYFDRGKDVVRNCEIRHEGTASSARLARTAIGARGLGREAALVPGSGAP